MPKVTQTESAQNVRAFVSPFVNYKSSVEGREMNLKMVWETCLEIQVPLLT